MIYEPSKKVRKPISKQKGLMIQTQALIKVPSTCIRDCTVNLYDRSKPAAHAGLSISAFDCLEGGLKYPLVINDSGKGPDKKPGAAAHKGPAWPISCVTLTTVTLISPQW